jgi:hypothetical protein
MSKEMILALPELPNWRVRIVPGVSMALGTDPLAWFCKLERRKKSGKWVTTVSGFMAYEDAFTAVLGAAAALQVVKDKPRHVRAGLIRPFATQ